ncbi:hypothetical protein NDZ80_001601 [Vibrio vulnificus]|nr:hypothetical protein [Vibrio vulnificus]
MALDYNYYKSAVEEKQRIMLIGTVISFLICGFVAWLGYHQSSLMPFVWSFYYYIIELKPAEDDLARYIKERDGM